MTSVAITTSNGAPTLSPTFDPRINNGLSIHYGNGNIYIGISNTNSPRWAIYSSDATENVSVNPASPQQVQLRVSTSNSNPDFPPELTPLVDGLHFHINYSDYTMSIGMEVTETNYTWARFTANGTIN